MWKRSTYHQLQVFKPIYVERPLGESLFNWSNISIYLNEHNNINLWFARTIVQAAVIENESPHSGQSDSWILHNYGVKASNVKGRGLFCCYTWEKLYYKKKLSVSLPNVFKKHYFNISVIVMQLNVQEMFEVMKLVLGNWYCIWLLK